MGRRREVLDASGLEAVTEFNQWLRGLDATAVAVWQTASREARAAIANATIGLTGGALLQCLLLAGAMPLVAENPHVRNSVALLFLAGAGLVVAGASLAFGLLSQARHHEAARTRTLLEHKLGFLHEQLEGDHVSPTGARRKAAQSFIDGKRNAPGYAPWALLVSNVLLGVGHGGLAAMAIVRWGL